MFKIIFISMVMLLATSCSTISNNKDIKVELKSAYGTVYDQGIATLDINKLTLPELQCTTVTTTALYIQVHEDLPGKDPIYNTTINNQPSYLAKESNTFLWLDSNGEHMFSGKMESTTIQLE